jgi:2,3-bisphosphoglycerate-independent phosphoglycerate mutase
VLGEVPHKFESALEALTKLKEANPKVNDQFYPPFVIVDKEGTPVGPIHDNDCVININFRADRVIQISKAFEYENFSAFDRVRWPKVRYLGMMQYDGDLKLPSHYLIPPPLIENTSGQYLCANGIRTFACSETQKFGHVTFFWNGNRSGKVDDTLETYHEVPSDNIQFNKKPHMKAAEIAKAAQQALLSGEFDYVRVNFANGDMVGHTGDLEATKLACESVDQGVKVSSFVSPTHPMALKSLGAVALVALSRASIL